MKLTYKEAGVDKEAGYKQVKLIKDIVKDTYTEGVLTDVGGFAGLFQLNMADYEEPVLVSGTDGVGTKLKIAFTLDKHNTIGEDCVAMCVNDILCQGAKPLFFLDYIATGKLEPEKMAQIVEGVASGCKKGGCALIGGETAEMPGFYGEDEYDLAGFCVGVVDKNKIIDGSTIKEGDIIIGLPSSGIHSNGYSLVRKVLEITEIELDKYAEELLKPTRIYTNPVYELVQKFNIKGLSHITGGGLYENVPRIMSEGLTATIDTSKIKVPHIFNLIQKWGNIDRDEMYHTFNMGIGMVLVVDKNDSDKVMKFLKEKEEKAVILGEIVKGEERIKLCH